MKTVDLIPFILLELSENDKYGLELTKAIETKSNGKIIVKQPTLYTVLKKLEKSKFISSYWLDSEIGGKRHYYKLTEFGKLQVSTLPSIEQLVNDILSDETEMETETIKPVALETTEEIIEPKEAIIPTSEVFNDNYTSNSIDTATETDLNINNSEILKDVDVKSETTFAENESVAKFTEKNIPTPQPTISTTQNLEPTNLMPELEAPINTYSTNSIKYVDYKNIKKDENYIKVNKIAKSLMFKSLIVSGVLISLLVVFNLLTKLSGSSAMFYIFWISFLIMAIFYPIITALNLDKIKAKLLNNNFNIKSKKTLFINLGVILVVLVVVLIANIGIGNNSFVDIFGFSNFENFYAPLLLSCIGFIDLLVNNLIFKKTNI